MEEIKLGSDVIFHLGSFAITSSLLSSVFVTVILILVGLYFKFSAKLIPTCFRVLMEMLVTYFLDALTQAYGSEARARKYLPYIVTVFLFLLLMNQFTLFPLVNQITVGDHISLFKISTADWSQTVALALITFLSSHVIALTVHPMNHISAYIRYKDFFHMKSIGDFMMACLNVFIGLIEIIGEIAKPISLSARLFGNIFAGELMVMVIAGLAKPFTEYFVPIPFLALGIFVGLIQAFVFTFLSLQFMAITIESARHGAH